MTATGTSTLAGTLTLRNPRAPQGMSLPLLVATLSSYDRLLALAANTLGEIPPGIDDSSDAHDAETALAEALLLADIEDADERELEMMASARYDDSRRMTYELSFDGITVVRARYGSPLEIVIDVARIALPAAALALACAKVLKILAETKLTYAKAKQLDAETALAAARDQPGHVSVDGVKKRVTAGPSTLKSAVAERLMEISVSTVFSDREAATRVILGRASHVELWLLAHDPPEVEHAE